MTKSAAPQVIFATSLGSITIELFPKEAPLSTENFLKYAEDGHFDGTIFHRVIPGFVIQGGGLTGDMQPKKTRASIKNEALNGLKNKRGTLSMARTNAVDSATSQFFVNLVDNAALDHKPGNFGYAVFGKVVAGMEVVDQIAAVETGRRKGHDDVPNEDIVVQSAKVANA
jgi:cyclophilin family peptidyl-prolyl cis-trans isomerase